MSKHAAYVPKHRQAPARPFAAAPRKALRTTLILSSVAVATTGVTVGGGVVLDDAELDPSATLSALSVEGAAAAAETTAPSGTATDAASTDASTDAASRQAELAEELAERSATSVSRSQDRRVPVDPAKAAALRDAAASVARAVTEREDLGQGDPRAVARALLGEFGWSSSQFGCLDSLWTRESGWNVHADNPSSSAYGIPQALPGSKMASAGPDWADNAETQIRWGLGYIQDRYGSPCGAWAHSESNGWYGPPRPGRATRAAGQVAGGDPDGSSGVPRG